MTSRAVVARVGLEVHAQIKAQSKLFSRGGTNYLAPSNSQLDLFDIALPGTLPTLNKHCVISAIRTGIALNCTIQQESHFDRKHYYYNDLPAGYQLTQYHKPIALNGYLEFIAKPYHRPQSTMAYDLNQYMRNHDKQRRDTQVKAPYMKRSVIKQIQLEQDSAKSFHDITDATITGDEFTLVDYNRSGVALMEIVFEPDLTDHDEATSLICELINVLKKIDTCDCQLQEGSLRVDANISIDSINGQDVSANAGRVELKNLNSLRSLNRGIEYEINRQQQSLEENKLIERETRTFDTRSGKSILLRKKEQSIDYRFIPEPSLPPISVTLDEHNDDIPIAMTEDGAISVEKLTKTIGVLPSNERHELIEAYSLDLGLIDDILSEDGMKEFLLLAFKESERKNINNIAKFLLHANRLLHIDAKDIISDVSFVEGSAVRIGFTPKHLAEIVDLAENRYISYCIGYELIKLYVFNREQRQPRVLAESLGWLMINNTDVIKGHCKQVITSMKGVSKKYARDGDIRHLKVMMQKLNELSSGRISFELAHSIFDDLLRSKNAFNQASKEARNE